MIRLTLLTLAALASSILAFSGEQHAFPAAQRSSASIPSINSFALADADRALLLAHMASLPESRWIRLAEGGAPVLVTEGEKALLSLGRTRFEDVQDDVTKGQVWVSSLGVGKVYPGKLGHNVTDLGNVFDTIDLDEMEGESLRRGGRASHTEPAQARPNWHVA